MALRIPARYRLLPVLLFALYGAWFWLSNRSEVPLTGRTQVVDMTVEQEVALGVQSYAQVLLDQPVLGPDAEPTQLVRMIGRRIAHAAADVDPGYEWEFNVIDSPSANAFALPGGKVAVFTGLLPVVENADGLAVVLGHEIAHAIARHGAERLAMQKLTRLGQLAAGISVADMDPQQQRAILGALGAGAQFGILLPFSREHESEADWMGLMLLARACFDPTEAPRVWERMARNQQGNRPPEWQSTHPGSDTRIRQFSLWMDDAVRVRRESCGSGG